MSNLLFILEENTKLKSHLVSFFTQKKFDVHSFSTPQEVEEGSRKYGVPDVLLVDSDYETKLVMRLLDRMRMRVKVIVCVTNRFNDEDMRLNLYLHGCIDVKPRTQLAELYTSVMMALKDEPTWDVTNVKQN